MLVYNYASDDVINAVLPIFRYVDETTSYLVGQTSPVTIPAKYVYNSHSLTQPNHVQKRHKRKHTHSIRLT